jgi:hypothetical protein
MKYKILKGTSTYDALIELFKKMGEASDKATELCKKLGGEGPYNTGRHLAGGIEAIKFDTKPEGWTTRGSSWQHLYMPKINPKTKKIWDEINALPVIENDELNKIVGFRAPQTVSTDGGLGWISRPSVSQGSNYFLLGIPEKAEYKKKNSDFIEILDSEYQRLLKKIEKKEKENA